MSLHIYFCVYFITIFVYKRDHDARLGNVTTAGAASARPGDGASELHWKPVGAPAAAALPSTEVQVES